MGNPGRRFLEFFRLPRSRYTSYYTGSRWIGRTGSQLLDERPGPHAVGWIKIENGQRSPSEKMLAAFVGWLVQEKYLRAGNRTAPVEELTVRKYAEHRAPFLSKLAQDRLADLTPVAF